MTYQRCGESFRRQGTPHSSVGFLVLTQVVLLERPKSPSSRGARRSQKAQEWPLILPSQPHPKTLPQRRSSCQRLMAGVGWGRLGSWWSYPLREGLGVARSETGLLPPNPEWWPL